MNCWQSASFNTGTCSWDVTGTQPTQPSLNCWESASFNTGTCSWDVTGTQPTQPTLACYETATFNTGTCSWEVTGTQPTQPSLACYESATFNTSTCVWDVTGEAPRQTTDTYCTFTQGFYGNKGGRFDGLTTGQIIDNALQQGPIIVGRKGSRSIEIPTRACIFQLLPGGGPAGILHSGDIVLGQACNPAPNPTKRNGTLQNVLLAQTITLTLNTRYDENLADLPLANVCFTIAPGVLAALPTDPTVQNLLDYANDLLGGVTGGNYSAVNAAISSINEGFDECGTACNLNINPEAPSISCPANYTACPSSSMALSTTGEPLAVGSLDACSLQVDYEDEIISESCAGASVIHRTWRAYYIGLESEAATCMQVLTLEDREAPVLSGVPTNTLISCSQSIPRVGQPTVTDNCASDLPITYTEERIDGECDGSYTIRRSWKVEDDCGNACLLYTSPSPRDQRGSRMPSSA